MPCQGIVLFAMDVIVEIKDFHATVVVSAGAMVSFQRVPASVLFPPS